MSVDAGFSELIGQVYEAAEVPQLWPCVLDRLRDTFRASGVGLNTDDFGAEPRFACYYMDSRFNPDLGDLFRREFSHPDVHAGAKFVPLFPLGQPVRRTTMQSDADFMASEMYERFLRPANLFYLASTKLLAQPPRFVTLHVGRGCGDEDFSEGELATLQALAPHLRRAVQMQQRFALLDAGRDVLDSLPWGILFVDAMAKVVSLNCAAQEMAEEGDGLSIRHGQLAAWAPPVTAALRAAVRQAARAGSGAADPPEALTLPRRSLRRPLSALIAPVRQSPRPGEQPAVVVFVADPERRMEPPAELLRRLYGFTPAEAALALALLDADGLGAAADRLGISPNTAKTHLQSVFGKTDTRRQAQLVQLLLRGVAGLRCG